MSEEFLDRRGKGVALMSEEKFQRSNPSEHNMNEVTLNELMKKMGDEKILSCLILKNNALVLEYYKNNKIQGRVQTINSCTKSIVSALIGILMDDALIKSVHTPITEYFGDIIDKQTDERLKDITIYHLLTMTPGFDWPEFGAWNYFSPMVYSNNIIKFILERPLVASPGQAMNYNSGCSHLLSAIIQKVTGISAYDYAKETLFKQLDVSKSVWYDRQGISLGADGLRITSYDMVMFGSLFLNNGMLNGTQIISGEWIKESTTPRYKTYGGVGYYAYHWWVSSFMSRDKEINYYFALGYGGQYIIIVPQFALVVVFTSRIYNDSLIPLHLFKDFILKAIED